MTLWPKSIKLTHLAWLVSLVKVSTSTHATKGITEWYSFQFSDLKAAELFLPLVF